MTTLGREQHREGVVPFDAHNEGKRQEDKAADGIKAQLGVVDETAKPVGAVGPGAPSDFTRSDWRSAVSHPPSPISTQGRPTTRTTQGCTLLLSVRVL